MRERVVLREIVPRVVVQDDDITNIPRRRFQFVNVDGTMLGPPGPPGAPGPGGALGHYGSFYDLTTQTALSTTTAYPLQIGGIFEANGISITNDLAGNPTQISFNVDGTYSIIFSAQFANKGSSEERTSIWFRVNGNDLPATRSQWTVPKPHGGVPGTQIGTVEFLATFSAGDIVQLIWQTESLDVQVVTLPGGTTPTSPQSPSLIVTAQQVMYTQVGPAGPAGVGVPSGGDAGTLLVKASNVDYDTAWSQQVTAPSGSGNVTTFSTVTSSTASVAPTTLDSESALSIKYVVHAASIFSSEVTEILAISDGTNVAHVEYGRITLGSELASYQVNLSGGAIELVAVPNSATPTTYVISKQAVA